MACLACGCSRAGQDASAQIDGGVIADGNYTIDVELAGGTGKAHVTSPARLVVANGEATATIIWSSSNYDLMEVDGEQIKPVTTEGGSTFEVPVSVFDEPMPVKGETTAMGQPHMIDYTLTFDSSSLKYN